jgi:hypothetical protein
MVCLEDDGLNTEWEDGTTTPIPFTVTVVARINKPTADTTNFVYDGTQQTYVLDTSNTWKDLFTVTNTKRTEAGTQTVTVELVDSEYVRWSDNTRDDLTFTFTIAEATDNKIASVTVPSWTYDNLTGEPVADNPYGTAEFLYRPVGGTDDDWTSEKPKNAGKYEIKAVVPATENYNGTEYVTTFTIGKALIAKPDQGEVVYVYDGEEKTFIEGSEAYTVSGNKQTEIGEYSVIISLIDKDNYAWADGSSGDLEYIYSIAEENDMTWLAALLLGGMTAEVLASLIAWGRKYRKG